jgi:hypothetical protein
VQKPLIESVLSYAHEVEEADWADYIKGNDTVNRQVRREPGEEVLDKPLKR